MNNHKLILVMIMLVALLILGGCVSSLADANPIAKEGTIDLTQAQFENEVVQLDGKWEFYWDQLLDPGEWETGILTGYIDVPSTWNKYTTTEGDNSGDGCATYRLTFITEKNERLALKIPRLRAAYKLWVNGELIASAGTVGKTKDTMVPQYLPQIAFFEAQQGKNELVIQVSNFHQRSGGILESLKLGSEKQILGLQYKSLANDLLLFGSLISIGVYHLSLFFFRKKNLSPLYFGLFCTMVGIRTLVIGESFLINLFPGINWEVIHKVQTLTFYLGVPVIVMFFRSVFPTYFHARIIRMIQLVGAASGSLVLLTPARIFTFFSPLYQMWTIIVIIYVVTVFVKIAIHKEKDCWLIILGALALMLTSVNDIVFYSIWMNDNGPSFLHTVFRTGNLSSVGQFIFAFTNSLLLAKKFSNSLEQEEVITAELTEVNKNLDQLVLQRTNALAASNACLEQLFTNSPDAIAMLDLQCRVTKVNPAFNALFGYTAREVEGRDISQLLRVPTDTPAEECIFACPNQPQGVPVDIVRRHRDGTPVAAALIAYPFITESGEMGAYAAYRDISQRFLTERMLKDSERKYRLLAENIDAVVWLMDFDQQPIYVSPSLERLTGYTLTEYLQQPLLQEKNRRLQAAVDEVRNGYRRGERQQTSVVLEEEKRVRDGRLIWIESTVNIAYDENGEALGILGVSRDITERKRTEKLLALTYERKRINHFFSDLLDGALHSEQEIYARARQLRVNLPQSFTVCFCRVEDSRHSAGSEGQERLLDEAVDRLNRQDGLVAWNFAGGIGVLCRLPLLYGGRESEREAAAECLRLLQENFPGIRFSIGVADYSASLTDFISRFRHAATTARIGYRRHEHSCIQCYEECGIDEMFDTFAGTREAPIFVRQVLGPLYDYDRDNGTELVETLIHILSRATLKEIAEVMFIHPKTITARKQRIEQILNLSLDSFEDRMTIGAALQIDKMLQVRNGGQP